MADASNDDPNMRQGPQEQDPDEHTSRRDEDTWVPGDTPLPNVLDPAQYLAELMEYVERRMSRLNVGDTGLFGQRQSEHADRRAGSSQLPDDATLADLLGGDQSGPPTSTTLVEPMPDRVEERPAWLARVLRLIPGVLVLEDASRFELAPPTAAENDDLLGCDKAATSPEAGPPRSEYPIVQAITNALDEAVSWVRGDSWVQAACARACPEGLAEWLVGLRSYLSHGQPFPPLDMVDTDHRYTDTVAQAAEVVVQPVCTALKALSYPATKPETDDDPETALRRVMQTLKSDKGPRGKLRKPSETLLEAIEKRPDAVRIRGDESGIRRYLGSLNRRFPGIRQCFVISGRTVTFLWNRFRIHCHPAPD